MSSTENPTYITTAEHPQSSSPGPIKPTLLAFHGSGSNATVHTVQLARLMRLLRPHFDVESLEVNYIVAETWGNGGEVMVRWVVVKLRS
ncbi:hypothetical protein HBI90_152650 [Parastagonospora nodorum]|nr:hypothetical protein HBI90_152650 [Parastagonospora nodorum]